MKRIALIGLVILILAAFAFVPARAQEMTCEWLTAEEYATHVVMHAQEGLLSGDMNPGVHHEGYSICVVP